VCRKIFRPSSSSRLPRCFRLVQRCPHDVQLRMLVLHGRLQPLAIAVIGGILISMVLSLIITPAVHFFLTRRERAVEPAAE
jgi:hypothetical protein